MVFYLLMGGLKMHTGELIKQARVTMRITQAELAKRLGVTPQAISQYERGIKNPKPATLKKIAAALGVEWYELISNSQDEQSEIAKEQMRQAIGRVADIITKPCKYEISDELIEDSLKKVTISIPTSYNSARLEKIIKDYWKLNDDGQQVAVERVHELTEIPRYKRKSTPEE